VAVGSRDQSFFGPGEEPIDSGTVDKSRESSESSPEGFSDWRHADYHVEIILAKRYKVLIFLVERAHWLDSCDFFDNFGFFFSWE
jgi:hypothetical protein